MVVINDFKGNGMRNALVGAALLGLAGCSVEPDTDSNTQKVSPYRIVRMNDNSDAYGYHVIEVRGGGKVYLVLQQRNGDGVALTKIDERFEGNEYSDRIHGY